MWNETDKNGVEPVLVVPNVLTKIAYAILLNEKDIVARPYHLEGRYGSRTFVVSSSEKRMGLPLLSQGAHRLMKLLQKEAKHNHIKTNGNENDIGDDECNVIDRRASTADGTRISTVDQHEKEERRSVCRCSTEEIEQDVAPCGITTTGYNARCSTTSTVTSCSKELYDILLRDDVTIEYMIVPLPKFVQKRQQQSKIDATIHPERRCCANKIFLPDNHQQSIPIGHQKHTFTFIDLFCGIGGFAIALESMGGQCVLACDIDPYCRDMYFQNTCCKHTKFYNDIHDISNETCQQYQNIDLLVGGFPCQPFSNLGTQPGFFDNRGLLYQEIVRLLKYCQPKSFLLENVPGLRSTGNALQTIISELEGVGYHVTYEICNSRGVTAQSRKRLFLVGIRRSTSSNNNHHSSSQEKEAVNKIIKATAMDASSSSFQFPYVPDLGLRAIDVIDYDDVHDDLKDEHQDPTTTQTENFDFYRLTNDQFTRLVSNKKSKWKPCKLAWKDITFDTLDGHYGQSLSKGNSQLVPCSTTKPRCLTPRECARLMGFPNDTYSIPSTFDHISIKHQHENENKNDPCTRTRTTSHSDNDNTNIIIDNNGDHHEKDNDLPSPQTEACAAATATTMKRRSHVKKLYHMFGNAVTPPLIAILAGAILHHVENHNDNDTTTATSSDDSTTLLNQNTNSANQTHSNHCPIVSTTTTTTSTTMMNWKQYGLQMGIELALKAIKPSRRHIVIQRLLMEQNGLFVPSSPSQEQDSLEIRS